jgi:hypothetical protein
MLSPINRSRLTSTCAMSIARASLLAAALVASSAGFSAASPDYGPSHPAPWSTPRIVVWGPCFMMPTHWNVPLDGPPPLCKHYR